MMVEGRLEGRVIAPRPPRVDTGFLVRVRCAAGAFPARVVNVSASGFRLRCRRSLEPGWEISLEVPKRPAVQGIIRWTGKGEAGGVFAEPVAL